MMAERDAGSSGAKAAWRNVLSNGSIILGERTVFGLVNLAAIAVAVRALGLEAFGAVVLIHAFAQLFGDLLRFKSWQAVLRYGSPALAEGRDGDIRRLAGLCLRLDLMAALTAVLLAWWAAPWFALWFRWPEATAAWAPYYALIILFGVSGAPSGLLRLFDRFSVLAVQHALNASMRMGGALLVWAMDAGVEAMMLAWFLAALLSGGWLTWRAIAMLYTRGLPPQLLGSWRELQDGFDGFWRFVFATNLASTLSSVLTNVTTLVAGAFLGPSGASLYKVAKDVAGALNKPASLLRPVIFPEIGRLMAERRAASLDGLLLRSLLAGGLAAGLVALVVALAGEPLLRLVFGEQALGAYDLVVLATAASALTAWGFALNPVLLAAGLAQRALLIQVAATLVYGLILGVALPAGGGLTAIGIALLVHAMIEFCCRLVAVANLRRSWHRTDNTDVPATVLAQGWRLKND